MKRSKWDWVAERGKRDEERGILLCFRHARERQRERESLARENSSQTPFEPRYLRPTQENSWKVIRAI